MKQIRTQDAAGHVLCHDITQIIPGVRKGPAFRKGHIVTSEDIPVLLSLGKEHLYVWEPQPGMLHENQGARLLYALCTGEAAGAEDIRVAQAAEYAGETKTGEPPEGTAPLGKRRMRPGEIKEGKIEILADADGFFRVDVQRLQAVNRLGELMIATRRGNVPVKKDDVLGGTRVIPLMISEEKMRLAKEAAGPAPLLTLHPYRHKRFGIITTGSEVFQGRIQDRFTPVLREKLGAYDTRELGQVTLGDDPAAITRAIRDFLRQGADLILCTGGMSVDPDDRTPLAIRQAAETVVSYGAPVLPGAMFMLAYAAGVPILGLPGCVMYAGRTIFDLILPRLLADLRVDPQELAALGHGGLCLNCPHCIFPNCAFGSGI